VIGRIGVHRRVEQPLEVIYVERLVFLAFRLVLLLTAGRSWNVDFLRRIIGPPLLTNGQIKNVPQDCEVLDRLVMTVGRLTKFLLVFSRSRLELKILVVLTDIGRSANEQSHQILAIGAIDILNGHPMPQCFQQRPCGNVEL
jgi:hypothetical protein